MSDEPLNGHEEVDRLRGRGERSRFGHVKSTIVGEHPYHERTDEEAPQRLSVVPFEAKRDDFSKSVDRMEQQQPDMVRYFTNRAYVQRQYFNALVKNGFSQDEALTLVATEFDH